ncbi:hypothetical protein [Streptomyces sp. NPDC054961]
MGMPLVQFANPLMAVGPSAAPALKGRPSSHRLLSGTLAGQGRTRTGVEPASRRVGHHPQRLQHLALALRAHRGHRVGGQRSGRPRLRGRCRERQDRQRRDERERAPHTSGTWAP